MIYKYLISQLHLMRKLENHQMLQSSQQSNQSPQRLNKQTKSLNTSKNKRLYKLLKTDKHKMIISNIMPKHLSRLMHQMPRSSNCLNAYTIKYFLFVVVCSLSLCRLSTLFKNLLRIRRMFRDMRIFKESFIHVFCLSIYIAQLFYKKPTQLLTLS